MNRRSLLGAAALAPFAAPGAAHAQDFPSRAITIVVPFPPGGQADLAARPTAIAMERALRQPVGVGAADDQQIGSSHLLNPVTKDGLEWRLQL